MLTGVVFRDFGALVTGGNMEPLTARMDFDLAEEALAEALLKAIVACLDAVKPKPSQTGRRQNESRLPARNGLFRRSALNPRASN